MKVQTKELKQAIKQVKNIVPKKTTIPILQSYLVTAKDDKLTISATDLELYAEHTILCESSDNFQFTIPASNFNLAEKFKQDETEITVENEKVIIRNGKREYKFAADEPDAFPQFPKILRSLASFSLSAETTKNMTEMYRFTSKDELRETLHSIYLNNDNGNLKAVATDGHRIIVKNIQKTEQDISFILRKSAQTVLKNIKQSAEFEIVETNGGEFAQVKAGNTTYLIREVEGLYPNWKRVIPDNDNFKMFSLENAEFQEYLKDCLELFKKYYKRSDHHKPEVLFDFKDKTLKLTYNDIENKINFLEEFDIETSINEEFCFNAEYLLDFASLDSDKLSLGVYKTGEKVFYTSYIKYYSDNWETRMMLGIRIER